MALAAAINDKSSGDLAFLRHHGPFAGKYTVERILGQGGMGLVFEARHVRLGQRVAIKVLGRALREHRELVARFEREGRAAGALSSAHAVKVYDIDATEDGTPYIVMELLCGGDLATALDREGPQAPARAVRWVLEACDAIGEAHRLGIVHRDLKPSNLFLAETDDGAIVKVLDFGIAKHASSDGAAITHGVTPLGTPQYMSPEQVRCAKDVDARTDIWSLGVTLYELVTGRTPFEHAEATATIASIAADPVPDPRDHRPDLDDGLAEVILRALRKDPNERYASIDELVDALLPYAADAGEEASSVRKIRAGSRPVLHLHVTTLGDDENQGGADGRRETSRAKPPRLRRAYRPLVAVAASAGLGLVALVATPRCVSAPADASPPQIGWALPSTPAERPPVVSAFEARAVAERDPEPSPPPGPTSATKIAPIRESKQAAPKRSTAPPSSAPVSSPTSASVPVAAGTPAPDFSPVHGGLSGPGF